MDNSSGVGVLDKAALVLSALETGPTTLAQLGEFSLIAALTEGAATAPDVLVGIGDDAAVLTVDGAVVTTVDALVEGVHFRRDWSSATDVGRKAVAVNIADLEAMGARPRGIVLAFSAPGELEVEEASGLAGFEDAVLLGGIFGEEFGQGDGLEFDGLQGGVVGEGRVVVRGELCGVRHCEERDRSCVELILWTKRRQIDVDAPWCKTRL